MTDREIEYLKWFLDEERNDRLNRTKDFIELYKSGGHAGLLLEYDRVDQKYEDRHRLRIQSVIPIIVSSILHMEEKIACCLNCDDIMCTKHNDGEENATD